MAGVDILRDIAQKGKQLNKELPGKELSKEIVPVEEMQVQEFDYSQLDAETASFLQNKARKIIQIKTVSKLKIAQEFCEVHNRLANNYRGKFGEWCNSIGYSRDTAENYIRAFKYVADNIGNIEDAEEIQYSLLNEISKPSTPKELQEGVITGDITSLKQLKELKEQLKQKEVELKEKVKTLEQLNKDNQKYRDELEDEKQEKKELAEELNEKKKLIEEMNNAPIEVRAEIVDEPTYEGQIGINEVTIPLDVQQKLAQQESTIRDLQAKSEKESTQASVLAKIELMKSLIKETVQAIKGMDDESKKSAKEQLEKVLQVKI